MIMIPIYLCLLPIIIILLIILIVLSFIYYAYNFQFIKKSFTSQNLQDTIFSSVNLAEWYSRMRGGDTPHPCRLYSVPATGGNDNKYKINFSKYITIKSLLKNDYCILPINDIEEKNPKLEIEFKEENNNKYCFEIYKKSKKDKIYLDILMYNSEDIRYKKFSERLIILKKVCKNMNLLIPNYKLFNYNNHFSNQFKKIFEDKYPSMIIFKSPDKKYFNFGSTYKWVNRKLLEIYGTIKFDKKNNKFLIGNSELKSEEFPLDKYIDEYIEKLKKTKVKLSNFDKVKVIIDEEKPTIVKQTHRDIKDIYSEQLSPSESWIQMNKGLIIDSFLGNTLEVLKRIHRNEAENKLFTSIENNKSLMDIGSGRGANWSMWKRKKIDVYAIEPDKNNYKKLVDKKKLYDKIHTLQAYGQDNKKILKFIPKTGVDYITSIYSLTFFDYKDEKMLDSLISLIDDSLKPGGLFIGQVMDGEKLLQTKGNKDLEISYECKSHKQEKDINYSNIFKIDCNPYKIIIYDKNKVFINIDDPVTLVKDQWEYIVDFKKLTSKLKEKNIILENTGFLDKEAEILNECPQWFSKLSRYFIFKKM